MAEEPGSHAVPRTSERAASPEPDQPRGSQLPVRDWLLRYYTWCPACQQRAVPDRPEDGERNLCLLCEAELLNDLLDLTVE